MHTVVETADYLSDAKAAGISDIEGAAIVEWIAANPQAGDEIKGTGGARKLRFPGFLLNVFAKNEKTDLTAKERNTLKAILSEMVKVYRTRSKQR